MTYDPEELFVVCNVLVGDDSIDEWGGSREDYFQVKWGGVSLRIPPGETRIVPRYLADHFASHLTDHILQSREKMIHDPGLRDPIIATIILRKADEFERIDDPTTEGGTENPGIGAETHEFDPGVDLLSRVKEESADPGEDVDDQEREPEKPDTNLSTAAPKGTN